MCRTRKKVAPETVTDASPYLDVEECVGADGGPRELLDEGGQPLLVVQLDAHPPLLQRHVISMLRQRLNQREVSDPLLRPHHLRDQFS